MPKKLHSGTVDWDDIGYKCVFDAFDHCIEIIVSEGDHGDIVLTGYIKWDGCANIQFEDKWLHFCGREGVERHTTLLNRLYDLAEEHIPNFLQ